MRDTIYLPTILFVLFLACLQVKAEKMPQELTIRYFSKLSDKDITEIEKLQVELCGKNDTKKNRYNIQLVNIYTNEKTSFIKKNDLHYLPTSIENLNIIKSNFVISKIDSLKLSNLITYRTDNTIPVEFGALCLDIKSLVKKIKKIKNNDVNLIWFNSFVPYKYSVENIKVMYEALNNEGEIAKLIPKINSPLIFEYLRPDETHYTIKFDSVGYFNEYEIEINCVTEDFKVEFIKEHLKFSYDKKQDVFMYYTGESRGCEILISTKYLANICYKMDNGNVNIKDIPDDNGCEPCKYECLYNKKFSIRVRGYTIGYNKEQFWTEKIDWFLFQCPTQKKN